MRWFPAIFRRRALEQDLDRELRFHLEARIDDLIRDGRTPAEARREAAIEFGGLEQAKEACRDQRGGQWLETMLQDVRYALRQLRKAPGFTATIVVTLALAIGACTAVFSAVDAILLRPYFRIEDPHRQIRIRATHPPQSAEFGLPPATFLELEALRSFQSVAVVHGTSLSLTGEAEPLRLNVAQITAGGFDVYGFQVALGRPLLPADFQSGQSHVIFLRHELWQTAFGGDPKVIGQAVMLNGEPWTVVGVGTPDWGRAGNPYDGLVPLVFSDAARVSHTAPRDNVTARLRPGVTFEEARTEVEMLSARLVRQFPDAYDGWTFTLLTNFEWNARTLRRTLWTLFGAVACVLLIACANVANLLLARASARQREMSVRAALGAGRRRLLRQLLTESMLLAILGGSVGVLIARWGLDAIRHYGTAPGMGRFAYLEVNPGMLLFTVGVTVATGIVFGLAPAWFASSVDLNESLKVGARGATDSPGRRRMRSGLVVLEIAATFVLLAAAGLLIRNFVRAVSQPGYAPQDVMTMQMNLADTKYARTPARAEFVGSVLERLQALPGVEGAAAASALPPTLTSVQNFAVEGRIPPRRSDWPSAGGFSVTPDYFRLLDLRLRQGRLFDPHDNASAPRVVVISESFARQFFPNEEPLGRRLNLAQPGAPDSWREIVGVVSDVSAGPAADPSSLQIYHPLAQNPGAGFYFIVRTIGNGTAALTGLLKPQVYAVDKDQPVIAVQSLASLMDTRLLAQQFTLHLLVVFSLVALVIAAVGIYGVISYHVSQRITEIGIRLALGASSRAVLALVVGRGARLVALGLLIGLAAAFAAGHAIESMLYHVSTRDPLVFATVTLVLAAVALLACLLPARRAMKVDPLVVLRAE